jgi:hypothetical protein
MTAHRHIVIFILTVLLFDKAFTQDTTTTDFFDQIRTYDLSTILIADSILTEERENGKEKLKRAEILGFIGDNYQRFFIHFVSVIKNPTDPHEYFAFGKTMVNETICLFHGNIKIIQSKICESVDIPTYKQGVATCDVILYENKNQTSTGFFKGKLTSNFIIDNKGQFRYDALMFIADGFSNNQFVGSWTNYKTNASKKCHWGDYRIPDCGDFDIGAGEFSANQKYAKNGWVSYMLENMSPNGAIVKPKVDNKTKNEKWWE